MEKLEELKMLLLEKKNLLMIGGIVLVVVLIFVFLFVKVQNDKNVAKEIIVEDLVTKEESILEEVTLDECLVNVDIKGEIVNPGLYEVDCDSRVNDIINLAGGITDKGDTSVLNLGKKVTDEMVIIVYSKEEVINFESVIVEEEKQIQECINKTEIKNNACIEETVSSIVTDNSNVLDNNNEIIGDTPVKVLVSLNNASKEELMTLSGIGESKANNIINYRNENGKFNSIDEIKNVKGIGDSIFEKIKNDITL